MPKQNASTTIPDGSLLPPLVLGPEADFVTFCEAYTTELASPIINPYNPDKATFHEAINSPDTDKWTLGIQDELKSL